MNNPKLSGAYHTTILFLAHITVQVVGGGLGCPRLFRNPGVFHFVALICPRTSFFLTELEDGEGGCGENRPVFNCIS